MEKFEIKRNIGVFEEEKECQIKKEEMKNGEIKKRKGQEDGQNFYRFGIYVF